MGYTVFTWPKQMRFFKDFTEYAEHYYLTSTDTFYVKEKNLDYFNNKIPKLKLTGIRKKTPLDKYLYPTDSMINEIKNILKSVVFSGDNLVSNNDLKTFDEKFSSIL